MTKNLNLTTDEALVLQQISESGEEDLTGLTLRAKTRKTAAPPKAATSAGPRPANTCPNSSKP